MVVLLLIYGFKRLCVDRLRGKQSTHTIYAVSGSDDV